MNDVEKLPKWARDRLVCAERDLESLRAEIRERANNDRTRVAIQNWSQIGPGVGIVEQFLNDHYPIRFYFDAARYIDVHLLERHNELSLEVSSGMGSIEIKPSASNTIRVFPEKR